MTGLYISAVGAVLVGFCALVAVAIGWKLSKRATGRRIYRAWITGVVVVITVGIMILDVVFTSVKMAELCRHAGLFINRAVKVDGFYTNLGAGALDHGFKYVESKGPGNVITVYSKSGDAISSEKFDAKIYQIKSRYEYNSRAQNGEWNERSDIGVTKSAVRDRVTGEELGYTLRYRAYPGWLDRNTVGKLVQLLWMCPSHIDDQEITLPYKVLFPATSIKEDAR